MNQVNRTQIVQLVALVVLGVIALSIVGVRYVHLDHVVGSGSYVVHADFKGSGGIFANAEVTYQGVAVGRMAALSLRPDGVRVDLYLDSDSGCIPAAIHDAYAAAHH